MSAAQNTTQELVDAYQAKLDSVSSDSVWIQLGVMSAVGAGALLLFSIMRPTNSVVYQPRVKYSEDGKRPPKIDKGFLAWVKPIFAADEASLMDTIGLDAVCFLRFLAMGRNVFLVIAGLSCVVLLPINLVYNLNLKKNSALSSRAYLNALTIQAVRGNWLWAHVAVTYVVTLIVFYFIWTNYSAMVRLRWQWFRSEEYQNSLHARSIIITQVTKQSRSDAGIAQLLSSLAIPYPTTAVHIGRRVGQLPELIEAHNGAVRALEGVLTRYFKDPNRLPTNRPTIRIGGTMGCGGQKVDAIDHLTEKIKRFDERIEMTRAQIDEKKAENYGFASFESVPYAHLVARKLAGKRKKGSHFALAPVPKDIIWENITLLDSQRPRSKLIGGILLVAFCFFYVIPLVAVSGLSNLGALSSSGNAFGRFIQAWSDNYPILLSAFVGIVPPLLSVLLQLVLPIVIRWLASYQGATTHSQSDRVVTARYSAFLFITQFFIFSLIGVIIQLVLQIVNLVNSGDASASQVWKAIYTLLDHIPGTWIGQSTYWLTVFPLRGASALFDLAQLISLVLVWGRAKIFGRTPREIREWTTPPAFDYPVYFSNHLLMLIVGFVYAPLAPLVPLFASAAFTVSYIVYKYQLMYVSISRVETGGRLWRVAINRVLFALIMMQAVMLLTIGLQTGWMNSIALAPPIIFVAIFKMILARKFDAPFDWFIPSEAEMAEVYLHQADARKHRLQKRFGHPTLHEPLFTPMLHKSVQHLLPTIYNGRVGEGHGAIDGKSVQQNTAGGLTFNMLEAHDLQYDRTAYLRQRDEDAMTVSTAFAGTKTEGPPDDYFQQRRAAYLAHGTPGTTPGEAELPYELSRMPTGTSMGSQENLIQYPPRYASPTPYGRSASPSGHHPNLSQQSFDSSTGPPPGSYAQQQQQYHQRQFSGGGGGGGQPQQQQEVIRSRSASPGGGGPPRFDPRNGSQGQQQQQQQMSYHRSQLSQASNHSNEYPPGAGPSSPPPQRVASPLGSDGGRGAREYAPLALDDEGKVDFRRG